MSSRHRRAGRIRSRRVPCVPFVPHTVCALVLDAYTHVTMGHDTCPAPVDASRLGRPTAPAYDPSRGQRHTRTGQERAAGSRSLGLSAYVRRHHLARPSH